MYIVQPFMTCIWLIKAILTSFLLLCPPIKLWVEVYETGLESEWLIRICLTCLYEQHLQGWVFESYLSMEFTPFDAAGSKHAGRLAPLNRPLCVWPVTDPDLILWASCDSLPAHHHYSVQRWGLDDLWEEGVVYIFTNLCKTSVIYNTNFLVFLNMMTCFRWGL